MIKKLIILGLCVFLSTFVAASEKSCEKKAEVMLMGVFHFGNPKQDLIKAAASWWHRNFRMYANIQKYATPGEKVLVIGGQGHTAILKDFLKIDQDRKAVSVIQHLCKLKGKKCCNASPLAFFVHPDKMSEISLVNK